MDPAVANALLDLRQAELDLLFAGEGGRKRNLTTDDGNARNKQRDAVVVGEKKSPRVTSATGFA